MLKRIYEEKKEMGAMLSTRTRKHKNKEMNEKKCKI